jgi:hypothetical protein
VTAGRQYVLFASTSSEYSAPISFPGGTFWAIGASQDPYPGGEFVYLRNWTDPSDWTTTSWFQSSTEPWHEDLAFQAVFGPAEVSGLAPTISGLAQAGHTLTADPGPVVPADSALAYQWNADGSPIAGATGPTLAMTNALAGARITVTVTASHDGYASAVETSAPTDEVRQQVRAPRVRISASRPRQGQTTTALAQGLQPGSTYTLYARYLPNGAVERTADQYGEIRLDLPIPLDAPLGYDVIGISGYDPPTAAYALFEVRPAL